MHTLTGIIQVTSLGIPQGKRAFCLSSRETRFMFHSQESGMTAGEVMAVATRTAQLQFPCSAFAHEEESVSQSKGLAIQ